MKTHHLELSSLPKTWLIDVDGVALRHNGHHAGADKLLPGVREFWRTIGAEDTVILLSARSGTFRDCTVALFEECGLRVDRAIFDLPVGERVLINDKKPSGLLTAHALNLDRDRGMVAIAHSQDGDCQ